ncbi:MAG: hypothetical protein WC866_04620 [Patescibacteria group bacterium]|jgi:hypothetical protein
MADNDKKGFLEKHSNKFLWLVGLIGAVIALPQDKIVKKGLPAFKNAVFALFQVGSELTIEGWTRTRDWMKEHWRSFKISALCWAIFALAVMTLGIHLHNHGYPFGGKVVAVIGAVLLQMLFVLVLLTAAVFAKILMFKLGVIKQIATGKFTEAQKQKIEEKHEKYKSHLTATFVLFSAALVPFQLFVSWKVLGVSVIMTGLALPAVFAVIHQKKDFGLVIETIKLISIGLVVLTMVAFLCVELFPQSFGTMRFGNADSWLAKITPSEWVVSFIVLGLLALLLRGVFTKDAHTRAASFLAFKWLVPISVGFSIFLMWKGTIQYKEVTNHDAPDVSEEIDGFKKAIKSIGDDDKSPYHPGPAPIAGTGGGTHMAPPPRSSVANSAPARSAPSKATARRAVVTKPLPPPPEAKSYQDDPGKAIGDLQALNQ